MDSIAAPVRPMPEDFRLVTAKRRGYTYARSRVLLARAHIGGELELLTAAWEKMVCRAGAGAAGTLRDLMGAPLPEVARAVADILDERNAEPVDLMLHEREGGERRLRLRLHRRFTANDPSVYIVAEELSAH